MFGQKRAASSRTAWKVAVGLSIILLCPACSAAADPDIAPSPVASAGRSIFASEEAALAEASQSYERYFELSDDIAARGGAEGDDISELVTPDFLITTKQGFDELAAQSLHTNGRTAVKNISLQSYREHEELAEITIYVCVDVSGVSVLNHEGADVTPSDRANYLSLVAQLISQTKRSSNLVLSKNEPWSGDSFC